MKLNNLNNILSKFFKTPSIESIYLYSNSESHLLKTVNFDHFRLARTTYELRKAHKILPPDSKFSYQEVNRPTKRFTPLMVSKRLEQALPFKSKEKVHENLQIRIQQKEKNAFNRILVSDKEKKAEYLIQRLKLIQKEKMKLKKASSKKKMEWKEKWQAGMKRRFIQKKQSTKGKHGMRHKKR